MSIDRRFLSVRLVVLIALVVALVPAFGSTQPARAVTIVIDGVKEAAWGSPLASDPVGDMSEPNLDLQGLYVVEDTDNYYIGYDATASIWGMAYGIYLDTDQVDGSGGTNDPWGRAVNAVSAHLPEYTLWVWHDGGDFLQDVQLNHWTGSNWTYDSLISQGGAQGYGPDNDWIEYQVPKAALGDPSRLALELITTGGDGHAQDSVPSDPNVAYPDPDWGSDVTTLSAFALYPPPAWYARGDFNAWGTDDPMYDDGTHGDAAAGDGIFTAQVTIAAAGRYEFKIATGDWSTAYPASGNSWLYASTDGELVTLTFDTNSYSDGWLPGSNIIGTGTDPGQWTAVGDWQGWDNANPATAMSAIGGGQYQLATSMANPGTYQYKAVKTGTWDAIGADGRSVNAGTATFTTLVASQQVTFTVDALAGREQVEVEYVQPPPGHDNNVEWDGLRHDSRDLLYRTPGGALPAGTPVTLRFRTYHDDVTAVQLRAYSLNAAAQTLYAMSIAAADVSCYQAGLEDHTCDFWAVTLPNAAVDNLWYRFIVTDGTDTDYYADNTPALDGGLGAPSDEVVDNSYALMVYDPNFTAPDWAKTAVIYQIFPDRFRNGRSDNDPKTGDIRYDDPVLALPWGTLPEGYCRNYADGDTNCPWRFDLNPPPSSPNTEQPRGRDYMGGDLKGVDQNLNYLQSLGVNTIYFNPIFDSGSNHGYDTQDYYKIDPYFGTQKDWENLVKHANQRGMRIILDGVFNHMSSDSPIFDRYHHYPSVGACEDVNSPYRSWFTFHDVPAGSGTCAGINGPDSTTYDGWFGFDSIPVINKSLPEVQQYFLTAPDSVSRYWLDQGASGWRLDVMGDASFPAGYWETFRDVVKGNDWNALIVGELWQKDSTLLRFLRGDRADTTMNYRLRDAVLGLLAPSNFDSKGFADSGRQLAPSEFASRLESIREDYPDAVYYSLMNLVDSHDTERILWTLTPGSETTVDKEQDAANLAAGKLRQQIAALIQFTMPGAPTVYYGDEAGVTGDDDPDDRRTYPWTGTGSKPDQAMISYYQTLTGVRDGNPVLTDGDFQVLLVDDAAETLAYGRKTEEQAALVVINRSNQPRSIDIQVAGYLPDGVVFSSSYGAGGDGSPQAVVSGGYVSVMLNPMSARLFLSGNTDLMPPPAPAGLTVTAEGNSQVSLAWDATTGAAGYNLYRSPLSGGGYVKANPAPLSGTTFTDTGLQNARTYYYIVRALDIAGNESAASNETSALPHYVIGWANLQWPPSIDHTISAVNPTPDIYGQVWIDGVTDQPGATAGLRAQLGFGPDGSDPAASPDWTWVEAAFNTDVGNNDEFFANLLPDVTGVFDYAYRYTTTDGRDWLYADLDGTGNGYDPAQAGSLTVLPSTDTTPPEVPTGLTVVTASPSGIELTWDPVAGDPSLYGYEIRRSDASGGTYTTLALVVNATDYTDTDVAENHTYYYVVRSVDTSFNRSADSDEVSATAVLRTVTLVFNVTVPGSTAGTGMPVYIAGTLSRLDGGYPDWDPAGVVMTQLDDTHWTIAFTGKEGVQLEYKYTLGSWDNVEKDGSCGEIPNRMLTLSYGATGTQVVDDTVLNWRNVSPCGN